MRTHNIFTIRWTHVFLFFNRFGSSFTSVANVDAELYSLIWPISSGNICECTPIIMQLPMTTMSLNLMLYFFFLYSPACLALPPTRSYTTQSLCLSFAWIGMPMIGNEEICMQMRGVENCFYVVMFKHPK